MSSNRYSKCRAMHPKSRANEIQRTQYVEPRHLRTQVIHRHEGKEDHKTKIARLFRYGAYPICRANALSPGSPYLKDRTKPHLSDISGTPKGRSTMQGRGFDFSGTPAASAFNHNATAINPCAFDKARALHFQTCLLDHLSPLALTAASRATHQVESL